MKSTLITLAEFDQSFDIKLAHLKSMLEQAGIKYITTNENFRGVKAPLSMIPSNVSIEVKVLEADLAEAILIRDSIA